MHASNISPNFHLNVDLQFGETAETQELYAIPVLNENYREDNNFVNRSKVKIGY